tara:strand:- start:980 stop:1144 length:165 start_codon:yes stop_codon:yes gene_type:complete
MYLGSKIFKGTVVLGKIIKLLNGNIGIFFGKFINNSLNYTTFLNNKKKILKYIK